jgi:hypothetical protein
MLPARLTHSTTATRSRSCLEVPISMHLAPVRSTVRAAGASR